ncbi:hypothetical protein [Anaerosacchariphilus polymeriproducens]|uniref:Uncharacterized protein n=1 Tax=Anaerosacchariphilus polymeriproducens TaxID=1812858 RepID=A0A371ARZ1_9FIRM|nr:hypothetical protein [Anaerosacchariphilus polymeriproducens]RDU22343.1 hypothetical protein DWV06_13680 [Anaerosacchariphilus polymeriproducens]
MIKKYIILGIRIVCLFIFVLFVIPFSLFILSFELDESLTVNTVTEEGKELLQKKYPLLTQLPENTIYDKLVYDTHFPISECSIFIYITIPSDFYEEFTTVFSDQNEENHFNVTVKTPIKSQETIKIKLSTGDRKDNLSELMVYAQNHHNINWSNIIKIVIYLVTIILIIVALVFPYGKIKKKGFR